MKQLRPLIIHKMLGDYKQNVKTKTKTVQINEIAEQRPLKALIAIFN